MSTTIRLYRVTCIRGYSIHDQGTGYSLRPWGSNTPYFEGKDDGGQDYILPDGFEVAESNAGTLEVYERGIRCPIGQTPSGKPIIYGVKLSPVLQLAGGK